MSTKRSYSLRWALFCVLLAASIARLSTLNDPFTRNHESTACGPMVCAARNMVRYGLIATRFGYVENADQVAPSNFTFYNHHPPLVPLVMAVSSEVVSGVSHVFGLGAWMSGESPWAYRLPNAICSVLLSGLLFVMMARKFDWRIGLATSLLYTFLPFTWLFGDMPDVVGPDLLLFGVLTIECYSRWCDQGARRWLYLACASWVLCTLCDWPAFFLVPVICAHFAATHPVRTWWKAVPFGLGTIAVLVGLIGSLMIGGDHSVIPQLFHRINGPSDSGTNVGFHDWLQVGVGYYVYHTVTWPVMGLMLAYVVSIVAMIKIRFAGLSVHDTTLMMLMWGLLHVLIGMESSYQHMWVWCVFIPGACAAAVLGGRAIWLAIPEQIHLSPATPYVAGGLAAVFLMGSYLEANYLSGLGLKTEPASYTLADFGQFIRNSVPSGQGVLTSDIGDPLLKESEPALWFYSDRQLRNGIRNVDDFKSATTQGSYPLFYGFTQHNGPAPMWFAMPCEHHEKFKELASYLDDHYQRWQNNGFLIYYLPQQQAPSEASAR